MRQRFVGRIAGLGTTSGTRIVLGRWHDSPFGEFGDAMVQRADGHRILLAPNDIVARFISETYVFDEIRIEPFRIGDQPESHAAHPAWEVRSDSLVLDITLGRRSPLGWALRVVPARISSSVTWATVVDPVARVALRGVRTRGSAGHGRREWYGATDVGGIESVSGTLDGRDLGSLAPVDPPCTFGFSSTPRRPSVTTVTTTVDS